MTEVSNIPLPQYTKSVPPGWDPSSQTFPLRAYIDRLKLWTRTTDLRNEQMGPAVAGRLVGRPFDVAMQLTIDISVRPDMVAFYGREILVGDDALTFPGTPADVANGLQELRSGLAQFIRRLEGLYGAQDQKINAQAIDNFEFLIRSPNMSLMSAATSLRSCISRRTHWPAMRSITLPRVTGSSEVQSRPRNSSRMCCSW